MESKVSALEQVLESCQKQNQQLITKYKKVEDKLKTAISNEQSEQIVGTSQSSVTEDRLEDSTPNAPLAKEDCEAQLVAMKAQVRHLQVQLQKQISKNQVLEEKLKDSSVVALQQKLQLSQANNASLSADIAKLKFEFQQ